MAARVSQDGGVGCLTIAKAMDVFDLDPVRWPELAADRVAWRVMLSSGEAPEGFRQAPPPPVPMPISHFLVRPRRAGAVRTNAAIDASLRPGQRATLNSCLCDCSN